MKIGIDAMNMNHQSGGIGKLTIELIKHMALLPEAKNHEFILYPGKETTILELPENWRYSSRKIMGFFVLCYCAFY